jgi:hypothetical protein
MKTNLYSVVALTVLAVVGLISCGLPADQAFDKVTSANLKTILLFQVPDATLTVWGNNGEELENSSTLDAKIREHAQLGAELTTALRTELEHRGFNVEVRGVLPRIVSEGGIDSDTEYYYQDIDTRADAILHVEMEGGYISGTYSGYGFLSGYRPWLYVKARLLSGNDKKQLYFQRIYYGNHYPYSGRIPAPAQYVYADIAALLGDRAAAVAHLQAGARTVAATIAQQLR